MTKAQITAAIKANNEARAEIQARIEEYGSRNCTAIVRLSDRLWDIKARGEMLCRMFDAA